MAMMVVYLFLGNLRRTLIIGSAIPLAILVTFALMNAGGLTLNIMTLGGLALGIGMLVDSSIVVLESIFRCKEEGDEVVPAAIRGTSEVRGAVFASTLTSIAVFFPMVFIEGIAGQAFGDLGAAVVISLLASLMVALFFIPMLASRQKVEFRDASEAWGAFFVFQSVVALKTHFETGSGLRRIGLSFYVLPRFVIGFGLELCGKLLLFGFTAVVFLIARALLPALGLIGKALVWLPVKLMDWLLAAMRWAYPRSIEFSLNHPLPVLVVAGLCF